VRQFNLTLALLALLLSAGCASEPKKSDAELRKAAETNTALGRQYIDRGQYEVALEKLKRAVAYDQTYAPAHTLLGVLYETIGEQEDAEAEYRLAVRYDPEDGDVNNNLGAFLCQNGKPREAGPYFDTAVDDPFYSTPQVALTNAGACALDRGELDKAESYLRQSLQIDQRSGAALLPMAEVSYRQGLYLRARAFLQRYEAVAPASEESLQLGIMIETALGDERSVEKYRAELKEKYPGAVQAGLRTGQG
jgi:type IV pilus assembly protein PilF